MGCFPRTYWGTKLLCWALLSVLFLVSLSLHRLQTAVVMYWSCVLLSLDFLIYLCPGQALLLVETSDLGGD